MKTNKKEMTLSHHLGELRRRVIFSLVVLALMMAVGMYLAVPAFEYLKSIPPADTLQWYAFSPSEGLRIYLQFSFLFALVITLPFTLFQLWSYVKPGLRPEEQKATLRFIPMGVLLLLAGLAFSYFIIFPLAIRFTMELNARMNLEELFGVLQYFSFMFNILIPVSLLFELPTVILFLTMLRIVNPSVLRKFRKPAYFIMVVLSTLIAPPDVVSNVLIVLPLVLLYEFSITLSGAVYRRQQRLDGQSDLQALA